MPRKSMCTTIPVLVATGALALSACTSSDDAAAPTNTSTGTSTLTAATSTVATPTKKATTPPTPTSTSPVGGPAPSGTLVAEPAPLREPGPIIAGTGTFSEAKEIAQAINCPKFTPNPVSQPGGVTGEKTSGACIMPQEAETLLLSTFTSKADQDGFLQQMRELESLSGESTPTNGYLVGEGWSVMGVQDSAPFKNAIAKLTK